MALLEEEEIIPETPLNNVEDPAIHSSDPRSEEPPSQNQLDFADALGFTPAMLASASKLKLMGMISSKKPDFEAFKTRHNGKRWATGKQRATMHRLGIRVQYDTITTVEASKLIADRIQSIQASEPPTLNQLAALERSEYTGEKPSSRLVASQLLEGMYGM
jgi:hypothetical protein